MDVSPQNVFRLFGNVWVTDTVVSTWVMMLLIVVGVWIIRRRLPMALELLIEGLADMASDVMGEERAYTYLPFLGSLAIFIAVANSVGFVPLLIAPTRDINTPLALAIVVFFAVHYYGIKKKGVLKYLKDLAAPIYLLPLTLPLELIGQLSRTLSLTLRLFGNIVSAELVVAVILSLVPLVVHIPILGLSLFTGLLQAYIFTMLATVYINSAVQEIDY
jgi:F-type H+-transporting ATPase subunit a